MRSVYEERVAQATKIDGQIQAGTDKIVSRKFGAHAKLAWPFKTAAHIAAIGNISERHAARIIAGEFEPPAAVLAALIVEITKVS